MSSFLYGALIAISLSTTGMRPPAAAQTETQYRVVTGSVRDQHGAPIRAANVQIENEDTRSVQSYLTDADGSFHFARLSKDTDYDISAAFGGSMSKKVSISKFDDKATKFVKLVITLK